MNQGKVPLYGDGKNIRDWIHVQDNCEAIDFLLKKGTIGEIYNISGKNERENIFITKKLYESFNEIVPKNNNLNIYIFKENSKKKRWNIKKELLNYTFSEHHIINSQNNQKKKLQLKISKSPWEKRIKNSLFQLSGSLV